ncbi:hypothetical protein BRC64_06915 [Halobacteriales archaeon QH_10_67_22]|nr:MAG: hypothetical protein BRC64_06915 [Halobacteriales archaeon QH_10_67_22]
MDTADAGLVVLVALGLALVWTAPPEPTYSVSVIETPDATPDEVTPFVDLGTDAQQEFLTLLDGDRLTTHESPALTNGYVRYKGTLYLVRISVGESSVRSLVQPVVGGGLAVVGVLGLGGRRLWSRPS